MKQLRFNEALTDLIKVCEEGFEGVLFNFKCEKMKTCSVGYSNSLSMIDDLETVHVKTNDFDAYLSEVDLNNGENLISAGMVFILFVVDDFSEHLKVSAEHLKDKDLSELFEKTGLFKDQQDLILSRNYKRLVDEYKALKKRIYEVNAEMKEIDRKLPYSSKGGGSYETEFLKDRTHNND